MKLLAIGALAAALMLPLYACGTTPVDIVQNLTTSTPVQVTTYADATAAADLVTRTADLAVATGKLPSSVLDAIGSYSDKVHSEWLKLKAAKDAGQSLAFQAFQDALSAFESYRTAQGIPEAPAKS